MKLIFKIILLSFSFYPLLPERVKGFPVLILSLYSVFYYFKNKPKIRVRELIILSIPFLLLLFSIVLSGNYNIEFKRLETRVSLLIIPLCFMICKKQIDKKNLILLLKYFVISTFILCMMFVFLIFFNHEILLESSANRFRNLSQHIFYIDEHPIYISIFLAIGIMIAFYLIREKAISNWFFSIVLILNFSLLALLISKGVIISLFLSLFILFVKYWKFYTGLILILISLLFLYLNISNSRGRIKEVFKPNTYKKFNETVSTSIRYAIYDCSIEAIIKKPVFGYGFGNEFNSLKDCYSSKSNHLVQEKYNSHNQYLNYILVSGLFGFIWLIFYLFKIAITLSKNLFFSTIFVFFIFVMLFENILSRQTGVILFSFFINFFIFSEPDEKHI